jgi:cation diffusion facilitator CzcD-associated flavoprotein CzcO
MSKADVLVIGAGPAGIACAYFLREYGLRYEVVDKATVIASTWANQYPSLRLNTTRFFSHLPGEKFPLHYGLFPTGKQYHEYLTRFVARHDLNITLGVEVLHVAQEGDGWRVETTRGVEHYPAVILASGRFSNPHIPHIPGLDHFDGQVVHASAFKHPADFAGQRVMVIGNGPSGVDLVTALPRHAAQPVYLAQRTGLVLRPRYPMGMPKHAWMMLSEMLPPRLGKPLLNRVLLLKFRNLHRVGIKTPPPGEESSAAGTRGPELIRAVRRGAVQPVESPVDFAGSTVTLRDGSQIELDTLILATGYRPALRYLDIVYETDRDGLPQRELDGGPGYEVKGYPGLYVVGVFYQGKGAMFNFNVEARITARQIARRLADRPRLAGV